MKLTYRGISYSSNSLIHQDNMKHTQFTPEINRVKSSRNPWLKYFKQIIVNNNTPRIFNPRKFWRQQKIEKLEGCWQLNYYIELFKICWCLEIVKSEYQNAITSTAKDKPATGIKLKYRGVTYYR